MDERKDLRSIFRAKEMKTMNSMQWTIHNPEGAHRIVVTRELPGTRWLEILARAGCRVEVCASEAILDEAAIGAAIGDQCQGAIGQLTETWGEALFEALSRAGGRAYSNYAVGYNNLDLEAATKVGIPVGNTPGVLTETTAELAVALTFAAARRVVEGDRFMREGRFQGWLPSLFLGELLWRKTLGVVGAGRIGSAYARMMAQGHRMDVIYISRRPKPGPGEVYQGLRRLASEHGRGARDLPTGPEPEGASSKGGCGEPSHGPGRVDPAPDRPGAACRHEGERRSRELRPRAR